VKIHNLDFITKTVKNACGHKPGWIILFFMLFAMLNTTSYSQTENETNVYKQGDVEVRIKSVEIRQLRQKVTAMQAPRPLRAVQDNSYAAIQAIYGNNSSSEVPYGEVRTIITIEISNTGANKKINFKTWRSNGGFSENDYGILKDNFKNVYNRVLLDSDYKIKEEKSIYPSDSIIDVLVFEKPVGGNPSLHLYLPANNFGGTGIFKLEIQTFANTTTSANTTASTNTKTSILTEDQFIERIKSGLHKDSTVQFKGTVESLQATMSRGNILVVLREGVKVPVQIPNGIHYKRHTKINYGKGLDPTQINDYAELYVHSYGRREIKPPPALTGTVTEGVLSRFSSRDIRSIFNAAEVFRKGSDVTIRATFDKDGGWKDVEIEQTSDSTAAWLFRNMPSRRDE